MGDGDDYAKLFTPKPKRIGRPKGSGNLKHPDHKSTKPAKLSPELYEIIDSEVRHGETISETILRLIRSNAQQHMNARKKVDALQERLQTLEAQRRSVVLLLNNEGIAN